MYEHTYATGTTISLASIVRHLLAMQPDEIVGKPRFAEDCLISRYFSRSIDGATSVITCPLSSLVFSLDGYRVNLYHPEWMGQIIVEFDRRFTRWALDVARIYPPLATRNNTLAMLRDLFGAQEIDDLIANEAFRERLIAEEYAVKEAVLA